MSIFAIIFFKSDSSLDKKHELCFEAKSVKEHKSMGTNKKQLLNIQEINKEKKTYILFDTLINGYSVSLISYKELNNKALEKIDIFSTLNIFSSMPHPFKIQVDQEIIKNSYEFFFRLRHLLEK